MVRNDDDTNVFPFPLDCLVAFVPNHPPVRVWFSVWEGGGEVLMS